MSLPWFENHAFPLFLAPMAGVTEGIFRRLCKQLGADVMVTEFVSAEGILQATERTRHYTLFSEEERPLGIQLFGSKGIRMGEAARLILDRDAPDFIDLNFGCPVNKVVTKNGGSALLKDLPLLKEVAHEVVKAVEGRVPVTAKIRLGWDDKNRVGPEVCRILEGEGIAAIVVHGRTKAQGYSGLADWECIEECVHATSLPVVGNGDIRSALEAQKRKENTGVKGLMIGRAAMENPWIFSEIKEYFKTGQLPAPQSAQQRWQLVFTHVELALASGHFPTEAQTISHMRSRLMAYAKGITGAKEIRQKLAKVTSLEQLRGIAQESLLS